MASSVLHVPKLMARSQWFSTDSINVSDVSFVFLSKIGVIMFSMFVVWYVYLLGEYVTF